MDRRKEPFFCRLARSVLAVFYPKIRLEGLENLPEEPAVLVGNHSQAHGPIISEIRMDFPHYTWCIGQMLCKEEVADYAYQDFWSHKPKSIRWLFWIISRIIPGPMSFLLSNVSTIPVYHDSRCITTFRKSIEVMQKGNHIVIFPEHEVAYNEILWDFQDRFIDLGRFYYKKTGNALPFVPMYLAPNLHTVYFGKPISFDPTAPIEEERKRICSYLMESITEIAVSLPEHTVVPYPNIPKRQYPRNTFCEAMKHETQTL